MSNRYQEKLSPEEWEEIMGVNRETVPFHYSYPDIITDFYNGFNEDDLDACWYEGQRENCYPDGAYQWNKRYALPYHTGRSDN